MTWLKRGSGFNRNDRKQIEISENYFHLGKNCHGECQVINQSAPLFFWATKSAYKSHLISAILFVFVLSISMLSINPAFAYEPGTTHAGITMQAALTSRLHQFLSRDFDLSHGIFSRLKLKPNLMDQRTFRILMDHLNRFDPAGSYRPQADFGQYAGSWIMAGSILGGMPYLVEKNHFYCPALRNGLDNDHWLLSNLIATLATLDGGESFRQLLTGTGLTLSGIPATEWLTSSQNSMAISKLADYIRMAVTSPSAEIRRHYLAIFLMGMGGVLHLLQDMASPTHVRNDYVVGHLQQLSASPFNRASAYERAVAIGYGQFNIPAYQGKPIVRQRIRDFFSTPDWQGLADITVKAHFSPGTVPPPLKILPDSDSREIRERLTKKLALSQPALGTIDLSGVRQRKTCYMTNAKGSALLAYKINKKNELVFFLDQKCFSASARQLLPLAVGFSTGLINYLLRGNIDLNFQGSDLLVRNLGQPFTTGTLFVYLEDKDSHRELLLKQALNSKQLQSEGPPILASLHIQPSAKSRKVIVFIEGNDSHGEALFATAQYRLLKAPL